MVIPPGNNRKFSEVYRGIKEEHWAEKKKLDLFLPNVPVFYSLKTSENQKLL